ncbi:methyl-accepting chemotaxis protein [Curvivirga aplysinae]|uniref:methyl-accepting chemotaxis protein n=1 Tax=Curvivirga aplysinae TaxID=2529852 RepID=UPI0012BCFC72|nr:methyl-accepting chemotaxis protein [Curvivirga aplysinae]MTI08473.1 methyl-accepting chemotaxis protein [Curvivirga aplysinae]
MLNRLSLSAKLTLFSALLVSTCLIIGIGLQTQSSTTTISELTLSEAEAVGQYHAEQIARDLDRAMLAASSVASTFRGIRSSKPEGREAYNNVLNQTMIEFPYLAGAWAGFLNDSLDGKDAEYVGVGGQNDAQGRYAGYYYNFGNGIVPYLLTGLDGILDTSDPGNTYFNQPYNTQKPIVVDPVLYDIEGVDVLLPSFTVPILDENGKSIGVAGVDMTVNAMSERIGKLEPFEGGSVDLISNKGLWVANHDPELFGKSVEEVDDIYKDALPSIQKGEKLVVADGDFYHLFIPVNISRTDAPWSVVVNVPASKVTEAADQQRNVMIIGGIVLVIVVSIILMIIGNVVIKRPMTSTVNVITALEEGNYDVEITGADRQDEIGQVSNALEQFKENAKRMRDLEAERVEAEKRTEAERRQAQLSMADDFESSVGQIVQAVTTSSNHLSGAANDMDSAVKTSQDQTVAVASAAEEASVNVQTVAASTEELSASINEISQQVARSATVASSAVEEVDKTNDMVKVLAEAADRIGEVVGLINDIADQTNLLALNATIEAARAGDAGKGFAVVANEVKSLAKQTANATEEIVQQITAIQGETKNTVKAIGGIGETINNIHDVATTIAAAVEEQEAATREISHSVQQAASGTAEVSANVEGMRNTAENTGAAANQVNQASTELKEQSDHLDSQMRNFLQQIREG